MNVRFDLACLSLLISCWCLETSSVLAANIGIRPRRQSRRTTLNEYLTPPAPPNGNGYRGPGASRHPRVHGNLGGLPTPPGSPGPAPSSLPPYRQGKILSPSATESPGYFSRLMGWLNPFGGGYPQQKPPSSPQQRPDNVHPQRGNLNSGYQQPPPHNGHGFQVPPWNQPLASYGPPSASYGPPTDPHERNPSGKSSSPTSSQAGPQYLPPQTLKNCDPCNLVPWVPLYHGVNTVASRYAAGSADVKIPESLESTFNEHQASGANFYHAPSHEVKPPDFSYGPSLGTPALDTNRQTPSLPSSQLNNNNQNFNLPQTEYRSPFTGPIPNPHLYTGAMPPLFKAKPFDSLPQGTSFNSSPILQSNQQDFSLGVGTASASVVNEFSLGSSFDANKHYNPSSDTKTPFATSSNQQYSQQSSQNGGSSFQPPNDDQQYNSSADLGSTFPTSQSQQYSHQPFQHGGSPFQPYNDNQQHNPSVNLGSSFPTSQSQEYNEQIFQNGGSSFPIPNENQSHSHFPHTGGSLDEGYVDELPPGAETASGPENQFPPSSPEENHANDNGASNSDHRQTLHASSQHEDTSVTSSINFGVGQSVSGQALGTSSENGNQPISYSIQGSSDGQHVIHYEQSPVIDLTSIGLDEKRKNSNDSSASSSTSIGALEDPPVVLQNADGTYGINATWPGGETSQILWPDDANIASATSSSFTNDFSSESGQRVIFEDVEASPSSLEVSAGSSGGSGQENKSTFNGHNDKLSGQDLDHQAFQDSGNKSRIHEQNGNSQGHLSAGHSGNPELQQNRQTSLYPGLINSDDRDNFDFKPETHGVPTSEEPFLEALVKSYDSLKKDVRQKVHQKLPGDHDTGEASFDPRLIHAGSGFQPSHSRPVDSSAENLGPVNRTQGAKRNKQVQIIIPYTSQYTPKPFHPSLEDWSAKTTPGRTQARKVQIFESNRDYLPQESRRVEDKVSHILRSLENSAKAKEVTKSPMRVNANTSIDVLRLQKNIDNWTIQEYSRGTTVSTTIPKFSRPYLSPSKKIPEEYLTTTEPVVLMTDSIEDSRKEISNVLAGFSFNDLEHESSASNRIDVSHAEISSRNEVSSVLPEEKKSTTSTGTARSATEKDSWEQFSVSISPLNKERVYVVTPQTVSTVPTSRKKNEDISARVRSTSENSKKQPDLLKFETIERAYQVLPQAVNNLAVASTGPATIPLWGIMEHEVYAAPFNQTTTPESPIHYAGHSKVSHTKQ